MEDLQLLANSSRVAEFDAAIRPHQARWPYHNEPHGQTSSLSTLVQVEWCRQNGVDINPLPLFYAMRSHDIGIHEDHRKYGFEKPELYAGHLTRHVMTALGFDKETEIDPTVDIVLMTDPLKAPKTVSHKIAKRADVDNIGGEFVPFVASSGYLWLEERIKSHSDIDYELWGKKACGFLTNQVLAHNLSLGPFDEDETGEAFFKSDAKRNIARLGRMLTTIAEIFESAPEPAEGSPYPDYETLLVQQGIQ